MFTGSSHCNLLFQTYNLVCNLKEVLLCRGYTLIEDAGSFLCLFLIVELTYDKILNPA